MNSIFKAGFLIAIMATFFSLTAEARTPSLIADKVHNLPTPPITTRPVSERYVHIKPYVARNAKGQSIRASAYIIDIYTGALGWESPKPLQVPPFYFSIPKTLHGQFALYYTQEFGWVVVPSNWVLVSAGVGADGGGNLAFVEPDTSSESKSGEHGWMIINFSLGNLVGFGEADGVIPGAHEAMLEGWPEFQKGPPPTLVPKPETMQYPNPCTAVFSYRIPNSPVVRAFVYFGPTIEPVWRDKSMSEIYLALPDSQSILANFILKTFRSYFECAVTTKSKT